MLLISLSSPRSSLVRLSPGARSRWHLCDRRDSGKGGMGDSQLEKATLQLGEALL